MTANLSARDLSYPVVYVSDRSGVGAASSCEELSRSHPALLRAGFFDGLQLVGADGHAFEVTQAQVIAPQSALARWWAGVVGSPLRMHIEVRRAADIELAELRTRVLAEMAREPDALSELTGHPLEWWPSPERRPINR